MQQNEYLLAKIGVDTAENEPLQIWGVIQFNIHFTPYSRAGYFFVAEDPGARSSLGKGCNARECRLGVDGDGDTLRRHDLAESAIVLQLCSA